MLRSLFTGLTGLRSSQLGMDVIGNNIANVNTVGYKSSRATFKEMLLQTIRSASSGSDNVGGLNPMQIGLGVALGSIDRNMLQGVPQVTNRDTDLSIEGNGWFILNDGTGNCYTRAGNFSVDNSGYLVSPFNGYRVQGLSAVNGVIPSTGNLSDIRIPYDSTLPPSATTTVTVGGNLDAGAEVGGTYQTTVDIYDSGGGNTTLTINFIKTDANMWDVSLDVATGTDPVGFETLAFNTGLISGTSTFTFDWTPLGASTPLTLTLDFGDEGSLTQYNVDASATVTGRDGYTSGTLKQFMVDQDGIFTGVFSNGEQQALAQLYLANFNNSAGLYDMGGGLFIESPNSGPAGIAAANVGSNGKIVQGTLEMSNVDLAEEFTNMIITQRAYQANARVISTSEELLTELLNLKR
ncbi:MAG: flagellar hook protein FlgE [Verrucomicrobia bacterium]|nr:flagellar hook protein FlgE [Verrucomicrobiota bacterium]